MQDGEEVTAKTYSVSDLHDTWTAVSWVLRPILKMACHCDAITDLYIFENLSNGLAT